MKVNQFWEAENWAVKVLVMIVFIVCFSVFCATPVKAAPIRVGIIAGGGASASNLAAQLNDHTFFDFNAVVISPSDADSLSKLAAYDVVILGDSGSADNGYTAQMFAAIRSWMDNGGGVVTVGWYDYAANFYSGQMKDDADYITPVNVIAGGGYDYQDDGNLHIDVNSHPITIGITDFPINGCCLEYDTALDSNAIKLGSPSGNSSGIAIAYQQTYGRSVYLGNLYFASTGYEQEPYTRSGVQDRLLEQAVYWASSGSPHVTSTPVPTLSEWGMIIFMVLAGLGSVYYLKRQRRA
jgi:hypothetical protein